MEITSLPLIARVAVADASTSSRSMPVVKANPAKGRMDKPWREKRTLKGKNAQNINPAKSFGKQKRFRTRKPAGAVALAATKKVALDCDDPKDITFASPAVCTHFIAFLYINCVKCVEIVVAKIYQRN
ncbi:unnamed protein product [Orchesella dallaii]|uniref:Uncharacterized protein n=1 Tax=Orchesella dallaii TaxID=48710 RepID=A0ABP1SAK4_9HEXA